ncbi:MAG: hypothetical protein DMF82_24235 [Acidobacteria bacterium]|nr:MAG: hypothetical protein DMF82_24235 [Acidobacteriota bacterium]
MPIHRLPSRSSNSAVTSRRGDGSSSSSRETPFEFTRSRPSVVPIQTFDSRSTIIVEVTTRRSDGASPSSVILAPFHRARPLLVATHTSRAPTGSTAVMARSGSPLVTAVTCPRARYKRPSPCVPIQIVPSPASLIEVTGDRAGSSARGASASSRSALQRSGPFTMPASRIAPSRVRVIAVTASSIVSSGERLSRRPS